VSSDSSVSKAIVSPVTLDCSAITTEERTTTALKSNEKTTKILILSERFKVSQSLSQVSALDC
jgi:hypothetical protein